MNNTFEIIIAYHCGLALAGIKPSNIVSCSNFQIIDLEKEVESLNKNLNESDIFIDILRRRRDRTLMIVYRKKQLSDQLSKQDVRNFLLAYFYPVDDNVNQMLKFLKYRINENVRFPDEIGAFLGYPINDILGFLNYKGDRYKLTGYWKVYDKEDQAKLLFKRYDSCRYMILKRVLHGESLGDLFSRSQQEVN